MSLMSVADFGEVLAEASFLTVDFQKRNLLPQGVCWFGDGVPSTEEEDCYKVFEKVTGVVVTDSEPITVSPATASHKNVFADILSRTWRDSAIVDDSQCRDDFEIRTGLEWKISYLLDKDFGNGKTFYTVDSVSGCILLAFLADQEEVSSIFDTAGMLEQIDRLFDMETVTETDNDETFIKFSVLTGKTSEELREKAVAFMERASCPKNLYAVCHHKADNLLRVVIFGLGKDGKPFESPECEYAYKDMLVNPTERNALQICFLWWD